MLPGMGRGRPTLCAPHLLSLDGRHLRHPTPETPTVVGLLIGNGRRRGHWQMTQTGVLIHFVFTRGRQGVSHYVRSSFTIMVIGERE